jgi:tetratricopeptide (TPR) repeat protein
MLRSDQNREERGEELDALLRREIGASGILARDPTSPAPPDSMLAFVLPTHRERPEAYDFAYWPGWYGRFTHMLFQARTLDRLEAAAPTRPGARSLLLGLRRHARVAALLGEPATDPGAWILFRLLPGPPWEPTSRRELTEALRGGKFEARFVAGLGAFLADRGETDRGIEMLRLALRWDPESAEAWRNLGAALLRTGDPKSAATVLDEALRRDPGARETRLLRARAYRSGGVSGRAVVELTQLLVEAPGYAEAHLELARAAADTKQWALVVRSIEAYLVLEPHSRDRAPLLVTLEKARRLAEGGS